MKNLRKLIRETYIKTKMKEELKETLLNLFKEDKELYKEVRAIMMDEKKDVEESATAAEPTTKPAPTTAPPSTTPAPIDPRKVPNPGTETKPKAQKEGLKKKSVSLEEIANRYKLLDKFTRFAQLIKEDTMTFPDNERERPHPETSQRLEKRGDEKSTPFADIEMFTREKEGSSTQEKIASKEFAELLAKSREVGRASGWGEVGQLLFALGQLEKPHKAKLVNLAKKVVKKELGLPDDVMDNIVAELLSPGEGRIDDFDDSPGPDPEEIQLTDEEKEIVGGEIKIRKIMNAMMMGGGYKLFDVLREFKSELDAIDPKLYPIYIKLNPNANLLLWKIPPYDIAGRMPAGSVKLEKKEDNPQESQVKAKAMNFAVLLHEISKGALEYLLSVRMKEYSDNLKKAIMDAADVYKEEHFHKILGPQIWKQVFYAIEVALDQYEENNELYGLSNKREMFPMFINKMATLPAQEFTNLIDDLLNPGQAEESGRDTPLERIKSMIHELNMQVKAFLDYQDEESARTAEFNIGQDNTSSIESSIEDNREDWLDDLAANAQETQEQPSEKTLEDMSVEELTDELNKALEEENYELAARIRDVIDAK
jgi:hypothetical protein